MGKRYFAEILTITPLGIPLLCSVGDFDELRWGIERTSLGTIFPLQLAEDNPVRLWWGITFEFGWGDAFVLCRGQSFQNLLGEDDSILVGEAF